MALGEKLSADKAMAMGMVNRVFPDETLREDGLAYAQEVAERSPLALSYTKTAVNLGKRIIWMRPLARKRHYSRFVSTVKMQKMP